jgi:hypothetical protein
MDRDTWLKFFEESPAPVQEYLLSPLSAEQEDKAQTALAFDNDVWERVLDVVWELIFLKLDRAAFEEKLKQVSTEKDLREVEKVLLTNVIYPLADMVIWDVDTRLLELGVSIKEIQGAPRISLRPVSYGAAARRIASIAKVSIFSEETIRKLRDILVSYLKGVRSNLQILEVLQRPQDQGGLGFEVSQADRFLDEMLKFLSTTQVMSEEDYAAWYQNYQREAEEEAEEIVRQAKQELVGEGEEPAPVMRVRVGTNNAPLDEALQNILTEIGEVVKDEYLQKRLINLISTRLRGMRNKLVVKDILQRAEKVGGLGLSAEETDRILNIIEKHYETVHEKVEEVERTKIQKAEELQKQKIKERREREAADHAEWYKERVQRSAAPEDLLRAMQQAQEGAERDTRLTTRETMAGAKPSARPQMTDIQAPVRLTSLGAELEDMTLESFRRLSERPEQAAESVLQKLDTLKRESFESWTEGVEAWRRSPLQQMYLRLVAESFTAGKPVTELVKEKREAGEKLPTNEELGAIIELNSRIHLS